MSPVRCTAEDPSLRSAKFADLGSLFWRIQTVVKPKIATLCLIEDTMDKNFVRRGLVFVRRHLGDAPISVLLPGERRLIARP